MAADGTAMTAGPDQQIAVYPKELANEDYDAKDDQGGLWELLRRVETANYTVGGVRRLEAVWDLLAEERWYVAHDGLLRQLEPGSAKVGSRIVRFQAGDLVHGALIRDAMTPLKGVVPQRGPRRRRAEQWAIAFHYLTAHVDTWKAQLEFGKEHLVRRTKARKVNLGTSRRYSDWIPVAAFLPREITAIRVGLDFWTPELDLAFCVYQSHSVNAPAVANKALAAAVLKNRKKFGSRREDFARDLLRRLGRSTYGRWNVGIKFGRYQRTRSAALSSGLWPRSLFVGKAAVMPKDLGK